MKMVDAHNLWFRYGDEWVLRDVSLSVEQGAFVGILGPNGSGKTTLLRVLDAALVPQKGGVMVAGRDLSGIRRRELARLIAVVPQEMPSVFPFRVGEIVLMGRAPHLRPMEFEGPRDLEKARRAMEVTEIVHLRDRFMNELSGGEKQRVLVARALAQEPEVLLLDEPTAYLDLKHQVALLQLLTELNRKERLTVIAVTHDLNLASLYCGRLVLLKEGYLYREGSPGQVVTEGTIREVFGTPVCVDGHPHSGTPRVTVLPE